MKSPVPGHVKTRLSSSLGESLSCRLYKHFTEDTLHSVSKCNRKTTLWYYPEDEKDQIQNWLGPDYTIEPQKGHDLGDRMHHAFDQTFKSGLKKAILIGTDIPQIKTATLTKALSALDHYDSVVGPSQDGGYYLIGFTCRSFMKDVFYSVRWGTSSVLTHTLQILDDANHRTRILEEYNDIDTLPDLKDFYIKNHHKQNLRTIKFIAGHIPLINNNAPIKEL